MLPFPLLIDRNRDQELDLMVEEEDDMDQSHGSLFNREQFGPNQFEIPNWVFEDKPKNPFLQSESIHMIYVSFKPNNHSDGQLNISLGHTLARLASFKMHRL